MDKKLVIKELIFQQGVLPLFFHPDPTVSVEVVKALYKGGIRTIEYTNRGEAALKNFTLLKKVAKDEFPDMQLGIGTIKSAEAATAFIDAGADYLISPGFAPGVAEVLKSQKILWIPGCMTPTEIMLAESNDIDFVKLFPGNILGPGYMQAIRELFPTMKFMPTGGVELDKENLGGWFKAGVSAVGMGSKLITKAILDNREYDKLTSLTQEAIELINSCKK